MHSKKDIFPQKQERHKNVIGLPSFFSCKRLYFIFKKERITPMIIFTLRSKTEDIYVRLTWLLAQK